MSKTRYLIAALVLFGLTFLMHRYLWARLVRDAALPSPWSKLLSILVFAFAVLVPLAFFTMRWTPRSVHAPLMWVIYTWLGFALYLFLLTVLSDAARGAAAVLRVLPEDPARRQLLSRTIAVGVGAASLFLGVWGIVNVARGFVVRRVRVPLAKLPKSASGYTIVQITDVHVGPTIGREFVETLVARTNALAPDMVVITGDLIDGTVDELRHLVEPLRELRAKDGVFFVTGNHEYYWGADEWIAHLQTLEIKVLRNERVDIGGVFDLAGVDDISAARMQRGHGQDVAKAAQGRDPSRPLLLLAHQPKALKDALASQVDLQLSGHVHGGQMVPFNWLAHLDQPVVEGLHLIENTWVYVSTGTGYWGPPMRVGTGSELTHVELISDENAAADLT